MECKNLIIITGESCQGKTPITLELKERCGFYTIHTDNFYSPYWDAPVKSPIGVEDETRNKLIRQHRERLTKTTVIEGGHIGDKDELDIFTRELEFNGKLYVFKIVCYDKEELKRRHVEKYGEGKNWIWESNAEWFRKIYNLRDAVVVESTEEIINFLEIHDGNICLSGQS